MKTIKCPHCNKPVTIDISKAIDEEGEVYICKHCREKFRYIEQ